MEIKMIPVSEIVPYDRNPRDNDGGVDAVAESIEQYGFKVPVILDRNNVIIAGHTRFKAAQKLGMDKLPCVIANDLNDDQARAFRIADNKTNDLSLWDNKLLLQELEALQGTDWFTGFDMDLKDFGLLDEKDNTPVTDNEDGLTYEVVFRSENKDKIEKIKMLWDNLDDE